MIANCALIAVIVLLVAMGLLLEHLEFLRPYAWALLQHYSWTLAAISAVLFVNVFALVYLIARRLLLKDTGRKLAHVEKQLRTRDTIVRDLSERLAREDHL
jgi:hypothetical protein